MEVIRMVRKIIFILIFSSLPVMSYADVCEGDNFAGPGYNTPNLGLCIPIVGNPNWALNLNTNFEIIDEELGPNGGYPEVPHTYAVEGAFVSGDKLRPFYVTVPDGRNVKIVKIISSSETEGSGSFTLYRVPWDSPRTPVEVRDVNEASAFAFGSDSIPNEYTFDYGVTDLDSFYVEVLAGAPENITVTIVIRH